MTLIKIVSFGNGELDWREEIWTGNIIEFIELSLITHFAGSWRFPPIASSSPTTFVGSPPEEIQECPPP